MPIYEFECGTCGQRFERLQKLSDPDPDQCPECGAHQVRRCVTAPSFRLAGSGWYETDFKKEGDTRRNLVKSDDGPKPASESSPAATSDAKPTAGPATHAGSQPDKS